FQVWIRLKVIAYALHQGCLRSHHHQFYTLVKAKLAQAGEIINTDRNILRHLCGAGIARGYIQRAATRALLNLPRQRMFASAIAYDENIHETITRLKPKLCNRLSMSLN